MNNRATLFSQVNNLSNEEVSLPHHTKPEQSWYWLLFTTLIGSSPIWLCWLCQTGLLSIYLQSTFQWQIYRTGNGTNSGEHLQKWPAQLMSSTMGRHTKIRWNIQQWRQQRQWYHAHELIAGKFLRHYFAVRNQINEKEFISICTFIIVWHPVRHYITTGCK